jgi:hypothetical protein
MLREKKSVEESLENKFLRGIIGESWELGKEDEGSAKNCFCWGLAGKFIGG